ncbi:hypothetical protein [Chryseobacterium sp. 'Rf worker isolate 10']|uniref:hypothetical protein n=1 Tax=Chryseobacterium sp. 'Rf worker isolate 10' TaxID=2887348 RepID=UPI003D6ED350
MRSLQQQLKLFLPLYKRASLLLFLFFITPKTKAQVLYYVKGTSITIGENTTVYIAHSGEIHQADLKDFEGKISEKKGVLKSRKQKKSAFNAEKTLAGHPAAKTKTYPKVQSIVFAVPQPDDFFLSYSKGEAISASVTAHDHKNYSIESKKLRFNHEYLTPIPNKIISNSFIFFKDYYWFQCKTRPPPSSLM